MKVTNISMTDEAEDALFAIVSTLKFYMHCINNMLKFEDKEEEVYIRVENNRLIKELTLDLTREDAAHQALKAVQTICYYAMDRSSMLKVDVKSKRHSVEGFYLEARS